MTKKEAKERIKIMQAWVDGETIQSETDCGWHDCINPSFAGFNKLINYRIKPKKKERFLTPEELKNEWLSIGPNNYRIDAYCKYEGSVLISGHWKSIRELHEEGFRREDGSSLKVEVDNDNN